MTQFEIRVCGIMDGKIRYRKTSRILGYPVYKNGRHTGGYFKTRAAAQNWIDSQRKRNDN